MGWTGTNPISVGDATKKSSYDSLWDNADHLQDVLSNFMNNDPTSTYTDCFPKSMFDADKDTGIQVEESADEDTIRFDIGGSEKATFNSTEFNLKNNLRLQRDSSYPTIKLDADGGTSYYGLIDYNSDREDEGDFIGGIRFSNDGESNWAAQILVRRGSADGYGEIVFYTNNSNIACFIDEDSYLTLYSGKIKTDGQIYRFYDTDASASFDVELDETYAYLSVNSSDPSTYFFAKGNASGDLIVRRYLDITSNAYFRTVGAGPSVAVGVNAGTDQLCAAASMREFKENISSINLTLDEILQLNVYKFDWKKKEMRWKQELGEEYGFIVDEVEPFFPQFVYEFNTLLDSEGLPAQLEGKDVSVGKAKGVDFARMVPLLYLALKLQNQKIKDLEAQVKS